MQMKPHCPHASATPVQWDYEMLFVQTAAIVAMVLGHVGYALPRLSEAIFPAYFWHMPMFVLISGYFLDVRRPYGAFVKHKCLRLLLPALGVRLALTLLALVGSYSGVFASGLRLSLYGLLVDPFVTCSAYPLSNAMWFIFQLFLLELLLGLLLRIPGRWTEVAVLSCALLCSLAALYFTHSVLAAPPEGLALVGLRTAFLSFFMAFGRWYRTRKNRWPVRPWIALCVVTAVQAAYLLFSGADITFSAHSMDVGRNPLFFMPVITVLTAAIALFSMAKMLSPVLEGNRFFLIAGSGTKYVVYFHELCLLLMNCFYMVLYHRTGSSLFDGFYFDMIRAPWYGFPLGGSGLGQLPYIILSFVLPLGLAEVSKRAKGWHKVAIWAAAWILVCAYLLVMGQYAVEAVGLPR